MYTSVKNRKEHEDKVLKVSLGTLYLTGYGYKFVTGKKDATAEKPNSWYTIDCDEDEVDKDATTTNDSLAFFTNVGKCYLSMLINQPQDVVTRKVLTIPEGTLNFEVRNAVAAIWKDNNGKATAKQYATNIVEILKAHKNDTLIVERRDYKMPELAQNEKTGKWERTGGDPVDRTQVLFWLASKAPKGLAVGNDINDSDSDSDSDDDGDE